MPTGCRDLSRTTARDQLLIGGRGLKPARNGRVLGPPAALERSSAVVAVSLNPAFPVSDRLAVMEFIMADARMAFRNYGSAAISPVELAAGKGRRVRSAGPPCGERFLIGSSLQTGNRPCIDGNPVSGQGGFRGHPQKTGIAEGWSGGVRHVGGRYSKLRLP